MKKKGSNKREIMEWVGDIFDNYEPSVPIEDTITKRELLALFPQIEMKKFERYQNAGTMLRARQSAGKAKGRWQLRYRRNIATDTMRRIAEMDKWPKYQMISRIIYLEDKVRKMKERGLKEIQIDG